MGKVSIIDWTRVKQLLRAQCSGRSIAAVIGVHEATLYEKTKIEQGCDWREYSRRVKSEGLDLLKAKMYEVAMSGDTQMLKFLAKNYMGWSENTRINVEGTLGVDVLFLQPAKEITAPPLSEGEVEDPYALGIQLIDSDEYAADDNDEWQEAEVAAFVSEDD